MATEATQQKKKPAGKIRGHVEIRVDECKGCGCCIADCPTGVLAVSENLNRMGYHPARYIGEGCIACGICFYACPEPGAITVYQLEEGE
jgi:2-oxoglutarate ferredoxin oxidoreductase subunit delta